MTEENKDPFAKLPVVDFGAKKAEVKKEEEVKVEEKSTEETTQDKILALHQKLIDAQGDRLESDIPLKDNYWLLRNTIAEQIHALNEVK